MATPPGLRRPRGRLVPAAFFARPAEAVAEDVLGKILWREGVGGGRLVEVEAYLPEIDPASHGYRGPTPRNRRLFGPPGHVYVYRSYGVHYCVNFVCLREGSGTGVLVRALEPLGSLEQLRRNRGDAEARLPVRRLAAGPGNVGQALGLDLSWDGRRLGPESGLLLLDDGYPVAVERTPRLGISRARELMLRFIVPGSPFLSRGPRRGDPVNQVGEERV